MTRSTADTGGELLEMELVLPPKAPSPPRHVHPEQTDSFEVLEGTLEVLVGRRWQRLRPGDAASVPAGTVHTFRNRYDGVTRVRNIHAPALDFEEYIAKESALVEAGKIRSLASPRALVYEAMLLQEHRRTIVLASPLLRAAAVVLAALGRLLRYRTS